MVGQFKDDCVQKHNHSLYNSISNVNIGSTISGSNASSLSYGNGAVYAYLTIGDNTGRSGDVTRTKSKGIKYCIKVL